MVGVSGGQLKFVNPAGEITTYAFLVILLACAVLFYRSMDIHMLNAVVLAPYAVGLGLAFVAAVAWIDRPARHVRLLTAMALFGLIWGWGCANYVDMAFDFAPKQIFHPSIRVYSIGGGRGRYNGSATIRHVVVDPWGPFDRSSDLVVSEAQFGATQRGASLCVALGRGLLGGAYYSIVECPSR